MRPEQSLRLRIGEKNIAIGGKKNRRNSEHFKGVGKAAGSRPGEQRRNGKAIEIIAQEETWRHRLLRGPGILLVRAQIPALRLNVLTQIVYGISEATFRAERRRLGGKRAAQEASSGSPNSEGPPEGGPLGFVSEQDRFSEPAPSAVRPALRLPS